LAAYGYIYNLSAQNVSQEAAVTFDTNGILVGITHTAGSSNVGITSSGTYMVTFSVTAGQQAQFALFQNGVPVPGGIYGSGSGNEDDFGQVIVNLTAGDVLTIVNHTSKTTSVALSSPAGGSQSNVDASIVIEKIA
jgi:hypothetical protein